MRGEKSEIELTQIQRNIIEKVEEVAEELENKKLTREEYQNYIEGRDDYPRYGRIKYYFYTLTNLRRESDKLEE